MKTAIRKFLSGRMNALRKALIAYSLTGEAEQLHIARVEIKKIKAVLKLRKKHDPDFPFKSTFSPFKKIFRACGALRTPLVLKKIARDEKVFKYLEFPSPVIPARKFQQSVPAFLKLISSKENLVLSHQNVPDKKAVRKYLNKKISRLKKSLYPVFYRKELHATRKLIKELYYLETIMNGKKGFTKFLKHLDGLIGDWHDRQLLIGKIAKKAPAKIIDRMRDENRNRITLLKIAVADHYSKA